MNIGDLVEQYGYVAVLIGAFLEGESVALLGGFFALRGYLDLPLVMLAAFVGPCAAISWPSGWDIGG